MQKEYANKEMKSETPKKNKQSFFFPKNKPPINIEANDIDEANEKLKVINNK